MIRPALLFGMCLYAWSCGASAGDVYRCTTPAGVAYQDVACDRPDAGTRVALGTSTSGSAMPGDPAAPSVAIPSCGARPASRARTLWRRTSLCIGMTDDEVLNLRGWGRPSKIVRTRGRREWREEWSYDTPFAAPRALHFVNGALAVVEYTHAGDATGIEPPRLVTVSSAGLPSPPSAPPGSLGSFVAAQTP